MTWKLSISGYWQHQSNQPWCWNGWLNCTEKKNLSGLEKNSFVWFEKTNSKTQHISIFSLKFCAKIKDLCFSWYKKQCQEMGHFWRLSAWTMGVREISHAKIFCTHNFDLLFLLPSDMSKSYRSWTSNSSERSSSVPRVTYRRLEKIASYHYLPRVVYQGSLKKSKSQQTLPNKETPINNFLPMDEFGSLDSLTSVTTFSYIASREQREREEDIYEVKPSTITIRKERAVPKIADLLMNQFNQHHANHGTCIRCHRPKMLGR